MDGEIGALADLATGGIIARAVEPAAGEQGGGNAQRCLNCGTFLTGRHCHHCGQNAHVHRHVGAFWHDFLHSVLHFEGKTWRTLPLLAWRPGQLTRRYIEGERAQFISPLALFLFTIFLSFAVFNWVGLGNVETGFDAGEAAAAETEFRQASAQADRTFAETRAAIATAARAGQPTTALEARLRAQQRAAEVLRIGSRFVEIDGGEEFVLTEARTGVPAIDDAITQANANPSLALYKMQTNGYKYSWLLIPLSAPFLWLLFPFSRRFGWYDHLVFVTYSISFMTLLAVALRLLAVAGLNGDLLMAGGLAYVPVHIYRQLRGAYRCSRIGAMLRTIILLAVALITLTGFFLLLVTIGAMG